MGARHLLAPAVALAIALGTGANGAEDRPDQDRPETVSATDLIRARCIFCHGPAVMLAFSQRLLDAGGKPALDTRLGSHHAPDRAAREAIVEFLADPMGRSSR